MQAKIELNFVLNVEGSVRPPDDLHAHRIWLAELLRSAADAVEAQRIDRINVNVIPSN